MQPLFIACLVFTAQGQAALNSAQQARKIVGGIVQNFAAADDATKAAQREVAEWDATILDLMGKLTAAHKKRAAASRRCYIKSASQCKLDDDLQHGTKCTSNILEIIHSAKRQKFDGGRLVDAHPCIDSVYQCQNS